MASVVAKAALGPRPGPYILKFWQGSVEIVLRAVAVVSELTSARAAVSILPYHNLPNYTNCLTDDDRVSIIVPICLVRGFPSLGSHSKCPWL